MKTMTDFNTDTANITFMAAAGTAPQYSYFLFFEKFLHIVSPPLGILQKLSGPLHYWLRRSMGFEKYKKWTKVDTCFSLNNPTKQDI